MEILYIILAFAFAMMILIIYAQNKRIKFLEESFKTEQNGKTSLAVKHGMTMEQLLPWSTKFDGDPRSFRFIGDPIDGILFGKDRIIFIEFKTGNGKLSEKQKQIKDLVEKGSVSWKEIRVH